MKHKIFIYFFLSMLYCIHTSVHADNPVYSVFKITTYRPDGSIISTGNGFFMENPNTGIASYNLFNGAARAEITDYKGNKYAVSRILGASSSYDLVKFQISDIKKSSALNCSRIGARENESVLLANYSDEKKPTAANIKIESADDYDRYKYYSISALNVEKNFGCPIISTSGDVIAIIQKNLSKDAKTACAIDARFAADLNINSTSSLNADLISINIPKALPKDEQEALSYIYMLNTADSASVETALNDFINSYPENAEGYVNRAIFRAGSAKYSDSEKDFATALSKSASGKTTMSADAVHYNFSKILYNYAIRKNSPVTEGWTMQRALSEAIAAQEFSPNPLYILQRGECEYALASFSAAVESFKQVCRTNLASPQTFYKTAQAMEKAEMPRREILEQLDSAVAHLSKPYIASEAYYLYIRATQEVALGMYRQAAIDLSDYEQAVGAGSLSHKFFAERSTTERKAKMFQQALDDIRFAQTKAETPDVFYYRLEEASIMLQVGMFDEAIAKATELLEDLPESPDCYKIIGIAYGEMKQKNLALQNLNKAKQLGDDNVDTLIAKYGK